MTIYTVEMQADTGNGIATFYAATEGFNTGPGDTPPNQHFRPTLKEAANFERALFQRGGLTGAPEIGFGQIVLINADGRYDALADYALAGRPCVIKAVETPRASYASAMVLVRGRVESVDVTDVFRTIRLRLYDPLVDLDRPMLTAAYAGTTNAGGQGVEGTTDLAATLKPRLYGTRANVAPVSVNPFDLIYQVSLAPVASIAVYDGGLPLVLAGNDATPAALASATMAPGEYRTCLSQGLFRLGGTPARAVTADVVEGAGGDARGAAGIALRMLLDAGVSPSALDTASFDALHAANPAPCGVMVQGDTTLLAAVSSLLSSVGAWMVSTAQGLLTVGRFGAPAELPVATLEEWQLHGDIERNAAGSDDTGIPTWRVVVRYGQLGVVQGEGDLAGAVPAERRAALALQWREAAAEDPAIKARWLNAPVLTIETNLTTQADAQAEAERLLALFKVKRSLWRVRVDTRFALGIELGETVSLRMHRFIPTGARFVVVGRIDDTNANRVQLDLWG